MEKKNRGVLVVSRDIFAEIFEYLLKTKVSGTGRFDIVSMKKIKYTNDLEVEISFEGTVDSYADASGRFELGQFQSRADIPPSDAFRRSRKIGKKAEEIVPELIPIPVKPAEISDIGSNMVVGIVTKDCKKGDMVSMTINATMRLDSSDSARHGRVIVVPKKKKIKKSTDIKSFDYDYDVPF